MNDEEYRRLHEDAITSKTKQQRKHLTRLPIDYDRGRQFLKNVPPLNPDTSVLELCGQFGQWGAYLKIVRGLEFPYTVIDKDPFYIDIAPGYFKKLGIEGTFIKRDLWDPLPFTSESFKQVWLFGWWRLPMKVKVISSLLKEIHRVLQQNGDFLTDMMAVKVRPIKEGIKDYYAWSTPEGLSKELINVGFSIQKLEIIKGSIFAVTARKLVGGCSDIRGDGR